MSLSALPRWLRDRNAALVFTFLVIAAILYSLPTGYEQKVRKNAVRCRGEVLKVDNENVHSYGTIKQGDQGVTLKVLDGPHAGKELKASNPLLGNLDLDKLFQPGDIALVVVTEHDTGKETRLIANPQDHYRIGQELLLLAIFALFLVIYGRWVGLKALLSFVFAGLVIWKILIPCLLKGWDPIWLSLGVVAFLCAGVIFLVAGITKKGLVAFLGAILGVLTSCLLAVYFTHDLHIRGSVLPFAQVMLSSGYGHLNLTEIYIAAVFIAASGAVMDLAMDVSASMAEVLEKHPEITRKELIFSGFNVGRAVVGTMTTTLLLAYSGGYITVLMSFMAQGVPVFTMFNLIYVAAEVAKTLVGSFGMVTVAPFTALVGGLVYRWHSPDPSTAPES
jgi:uncharacterized membrane protein